MKDFLEIYNYIDSHTDYVLDHHNLNSLVDVIKSTENGKVEKGNFIIGWNTQVSHEVAVHVYRIIS